MSEFDDIEKMVRDRDYFEEYLKITTDEEEIKEYKMIVETLNKKLAKYGL